MDHRIAVVTPAFRARPFIADAVRSVLAQTNPDWEQWIISDDGEDYEAILAAAGLRDRRLKFLSTGTVGAGASRARNLALDRIDAPYLAILDADDRLKADKLARVAKALDSHPIVSSCLDVRTVRYDHLRFVGIGPDRVLSPAAYKFTNLSMDSMIVWDRRRCDARYDTDLSNMTDLELLLQLWRQAETVAHLGAPAHDYVKVSSSMSNGEGFTERMIRSKQTLRERLATGAYSFAAPGTAEGVMAFLDISLAAEALYPERLAAEPGLLFEDHIEPMLRASEARREAC